jgi:hypothetical protein
VGNLSPTLTLTLTLNLNLTITLTITLTLTLTLTLQAWEIYKLSPKTDNMVHLGTNLAMEVAPWLGYTKHWLDLKALLEDPALTAEMHAKDRVLHASVLLAMEERKPETAQQIIKYGGLLSLATEPP